MHSLKRPNGCPEKAEADITFELQRRPFSRLAALQQDLIKHGLKLDTLSMGMSRDFEAAIAEGATWVRIGSAIFGARDIKVSTGQKSQ